jgi:hypothetical protein
MVERVRGIDLHQVGAVVVLVCDRTRLGRH